MASQTILDDLNEEQRLKVEGALHYLGQVKHTFRNHPLIFNDFLDIMKHLKSQGIVTPGVIVRVSNLFREHPELIVGFSVFLPAGYKIELPTNDQVSVSMLSQSGSYVVNTVFIGELSGSTSQGATQPTTAIIQQHSMGGIAPPSTGQQTHHGLDHGSGSQQNQQRSGSPNPSGTLGTSGNNFESTSASSFTDSYSSPSIQSAFSTFTTNPIEFNHAVNYIIKIKNRFQTNPEKYEHFLKILQTYKNDQRNIKEGLPPKHFTEHEVYPQVERLFENQDDLLQEFAQYFPERDVPNHQNDVGLDRDDKRRVCTIL